MSRVVVTVGMGEWPFDRLLAALGPVCVEHDVFAQVGASLVTPPCPYVAYLAAQELQALIEAADVVITHAGNTVRLVQRMGKVPIAVAREPARGEVANQHQVDFLRLEERTGRVVAVWDVDDLAAAVREHPSVEAELLAWRPAPLAPDVELIRTVMREICARIIR